FNILDKIVQKVLGDHQNPRLIKDLLQDLSSTLCILIRGVGKSVLVGNINIWICRLETVLRWQQQLQNLQMTEVDSGLTLSDLPVHMLSNILYRFSDGWDIVTLGQVTPTLSALSEDRQLWKKLCQYHFGEKQFCRHLILSEKGHVEWKLMYFALQKHYPTKEQYGDTLHFCRHCSILFWKDCCLALLLEDSGHPCTAAASRLCPRSTSSTFSSTEGLARPTMTWSLRWRQREKGLWAGCLWLPPLKPGQGTPAKSTFEIGSRNPSKIISASLFKKFFYVHL
uniref:F-box only protein 25 n=1 Tax=Bos indicus x Bos taurus TaxID=30522 RepID=A0A4W2EHY4_BOBOX